MIFEFSTFELDTDTMQLLNNGEDVPIEPLVFKVLLHLVQNNSRVASRDELIEEIWDGRFVSDSALSSSIKSVRAAIGDNGKEQKLIRTVHGVGFRFVGSITTRQTSNDSGLQGGKTHNSPTPLQPPTVSREKPCIVLFPFDVSNATEDQADFSAGLFDDINTALVRTGAFSVTDSSHGIGEFLQRFQEQASNDDARYALTGTIRFAGTKFRLNARLLNPLSREEIWAERIDGTMDDRFAAQDTVTESLVGVLQPNILFAEVRRAVSHEVAGDEAYTRLLRTVPLCFSLQRTQNKLAAEELRQIIGSNENYGLAHALLSWCYGQQVAYGWAEAVDVIKSTALHHARAAYQLSPDNSLVLIFLGNAECTSGHIEDAEAHVMRGLQIDSNSAWGWHRMGYIHAYLGRSKRSIECFERSMTLSPLDPMRANLMIGMALAHFNGKNYGTALDWAKAALREEPELIWAHRLIAVCAAYDNQPSLAAASVAIVNEKMSNPTIEEIMRAIPHKDETMRAHYLAGLRMAGFSE